MPYLLVTSSIAARRRLAGICQQVTDKKLPRDNVSVERPYLKRLWISWSQATQLKSPPL